MKSTALPRVAAALSLLALASCAANTQLTNVWSDPALAGKTYQNIVVVGVIKSSTLRRQYEDTFCRDLESRGVKATPSYSITGEGQIDKDAFDAKINELGADGVIVTRLVDQQQVQNYYPPTYSTMAAPSAYYGGWYGYYNMGYTYMSSPGYVTTDQLYRIETNLYDVKESKLAWSGLTETTLMSGDNPSKEVDPFIGTLVYNMQEKKVIPPQKRK
ncbi:MAG TPA: hypothetical protein VMJ70_16210 [Candidatus Sulfotelmatobacter sp.]|nr:hypothetical protein [Candidatus Sulfotelmatobacter sp.]